MSLSQPGEHGGCDVSAEQRRGLGNAGRWCPTCKGRMKLWLYADVYLECPTCFDKTKCGTCGGRGQIPRWDGRFFDCPDCDAKGQLPKPKTFVFHGVTYYPHRNRVYSPATEAGVAHLMEAAR